MRVIVTLPILQTRQDPNAGNSHAALTASKTQMRVIATQPWLPSKQDPNDENSYAALTAHKCTCGSLSRRQQYRPDKTKMPEIATLALTTDKTRPDIHPPSDQSYLLPLEHLKVDVFPPDDICVPLTEISSRTVFLPSCSDISKVPSFILR